MNAKKDSPLIEVPRSIERDLYRNGDKEWTFNKGSVREAFLRVYSPKENYVLFRTVANKKAADALTQYVAIRDGMNSPWNVRKASEHIEPRQIQGGAEESHRMSFRNELMDTYIEAVDRLAKKKIGTNSFAHYPLVETVGVHNLDRDPKAIFWPRVYIVKSERHDELINIIDNMLDKESHNVLRDIESPQFYRMAEIETLQKLGIPPVLHSSYEIKMNARELSVCIDFFSQMNQTCRWTGNVVWED